ncbi:MAG: GntR family transcriptional regulator [Oxalobacteraceae bacterium]|nr:MAG: GntR family transcriptional regulator [Oxalobacteraceae bacterium]
MTEAMEAAALLRERLLNGEFGPGVRLQQIPLAATLGISRTPLREALLILAREGLLSYEPNRGYAVQAFGASDIDQAYQVRAQLEAFACHLCARQGLPDAGQEVLAECLVRGDRILALGQLRAEDLPEYRAMNVTFHETILDGARNRFVSDFVRQTQNVPFASDRVFVWEDHAVITRSHDDHHRIVQAIRDRDAARAGALMREHIVNAGQILIMSMAGRLHSDSSGVVG